MGKFTIHFWHMDNRRRPIFSSLKLLPSDLLLWVLLFCLPTQEVREFQLQLCVCIIANETSTVVLGTGLMVGVTPEMGGEGYKLFTEVNGGKCHPLPLPQIFQYTYHFSPSGIPPVMRHKDPAASCSNALVAILDPSLDGK